MKQAKKSFGRGEQIAAAVRQFVAEIIRDNYSDLGITIVDAKSSGGLQFVRLFYQGQEQDLKKITGAVRYELAHRMNQKYVPELEFVYDETIETSQKIEALLSAAEKSYK